MNFMKQAFSLANRASLHDDVPIGAVIVKNGIVISRGENRVQLKNNPMLHAEIVAINNACKKLGSKFLIDCEIYITLEPCAMCATAISYARIKTIHFAAIDEKGGAIFGNAKIFETDKHLWKPEIIQDTGAAEKSSYLLKEFFKSKRTKK